MVDKENSLVQAAIQRGAIPDGWKPVDTADFIKLENPGDKITGRLLSKVPTDMKKGGKINKYTLRTDDNKLVSFLGSKYLDDLMFNVHVGTNVYIVYDHDQELDGGNLMKIFQVFTR